MPGDRLSPHALDSYAQAHRQHDSAALFYSDEDHIDCRGDRTDPVFKPGWSPEFLRSALYLGRSVLYRRDLLLSGAIRESPRASSPPSALPPRSSPPVSRASPRNTRLRPKPNSASSYAPGRHGKCVNVWKRCGLQPVPRVRDPGSAPSRIGNGRRHAAMCRTIRRNLNPLPWRLRLCADEQSGSLQATAPYLLFMNDDVWCGGAGWDQAIVATLARPEIGIAGAVLEYPNGSIQHAGVVVGMGDGAGHCGRFQMTSELWPWLRMSRDVSAVTGAMLGIRTELFRQMSGFERRSPSITTMWICVSGRGSRLAGGVFEPG